METMNTKTPFQIYFEVWPLIRLLLYISIVFRRVSYAVPRHSHMFKHGSFALPAHVVLSITQLVLFELRRVRVLDPRLTGIEVLICVAWCILGLRLVRPLRRGHPVTNRAIYQLSALSRPLFEDVAWQTGSSTPYHMSIMLLDTFLWVRIQLGIFQVVPILTGAAAYAFAIPMSGVLSLWYWEMLWGVIPLNVGMIAFIALNKLVSRTLSKRRNGHRQNGLWACVDKIAGGLAAAGFTELETLRFLYRYAPVFAEKMDDSYGYISPDLIAGVALSKMHYD